MEAFMRSTLFTQTTNIPDNGKYDERKQLVDNKSQTSKDKPHVITKKYLLEDEETTGNNTDFETDPKVSPHNVDEESNMQQDKQINPLHKKS